jgi:GT2 family glycosyltransferase
MNAQPLISVVLPTYHRNDMLALCLDRLAPGTQTLDAALYEVIITDDGSKTTAEAMVREKYPWARWVAGPKRGPAANRNGAIRHARTEWIAFIDDDCLPEPEWLSAYANAIQPGTLVYEGRTVCREPVRWLVEETPVNETGGALWSCNMMISRTLFQEMGGFDEAFPFSFMEDVDFRERLTARGIAFPFVADAVVAHPPRPRRFGAKMGQMHECTVLMWYKSGKQEPVRQRLLKRVIMDRLSALKRQPLSKDSWTAFVSMLGEAHVVAWHGREWDERYRQQYQGKTPDYQNHYLMPSP